MWRSAFRLTQRETIAALLAGAVSFSVSSGSLLTSLSSHSARRTSGLTREYIRTHDELLNEMQMGIRGKFADVHAAFRAFDTNADGLISL